jgi:N-sulfoglucosamine sulfohydrolase
VLASFSDPHKPYRGQVEGLPEKMLGPGEVKPFFQHGEFNTAEIREEVAGYYNAVKRVDIGVGLLLDMLDRTGQAANTLVIFLGDHGPPVSRGKTTTYEFGTRIPFLVRWPDCAQPKVTDAFVSTTDIVPTCLAAAGISLPIPLAGRDLSPFYRGHPDSWRQHLFTEFTTHGPGFAPQRAVRGRRYKLIHNLVIGREKNGIGVDGCPIREILDDEEWKDTDTRRVFRLIEDPPEFELYDLKEDPLEYRNLAGDTSVSAVETALKGALMGWRRKTHDPLLDNAYLEKLMRHTDNHLVQYRAARDKADAEGTERPYNRIDMTSFQEDWPTPWMK